VARRRKGAEISLGMMLFSDLGDLAQLFFFVRIRRHNSYSGPGGARGRSHEVIMERHHAHQKLRTTGVTRAFSRTYVPWVLFELVLRRCCVCLRDVGWYTTFSGYKSSGWDRGVQSLVTGKIWATVGWKVQ
jgi:hypothetical protein